MEPPQKKVQGDVKAILIKGSKEERRALLEEATEETFPQFREYNQIKDKIVVKDAENIIMYCEHFPRLGWSEVLADLLAQEVLAMGHLRQADFEKNDEILANTFFALPSDAIKFKSEVIWSMTATCS